MTASGKKFETKRTQNFRSAELDESEERTIAQIETHGCSVIQIESSTTGPGWSYTAGVYDTCGQPELVVVGLKGSTAHYLLNAAADSLRRGVNLAQGRHREMVGEVECEFRPVDPKWVKHLMGWSIWFNGNSDFPVLQVVYPDLENRFPEDPGFTEYFRQPLLQPEASMTKVEKDFWASADPDSSLFNWKFPDPPHTHVFLSQAVQSGESITYVSHDIEDGAWQFLGDSMSGGLNPVVSCFHHPIDQDPTLVELADLPVGWWAERLKPGEPWIRCKHEQDSASESE
jgi:hypothetical protein